MTGVCNNNGKMKGMEYVASNREVDDVLKRNGNGRENLVPREGNENF